MISVIVTEYKKRGYLIHALRSVFNQSLDRDKYEVIVVKNYEDKEVDEYARKNGAKIIISNEKWLGPKIAQGLEEAKGDVISLLEDDDLFLPNKLEVVYNTFKKYENLSLFKNPVKILNYLDREFIPQMPKKPFYVSNSTLNKKIIKEISKLGIAWNTSSLCFNRNMLLKYKDCLKKIKMSVDSLGYLFLSNYDILVWDSPLSIYRIHKAHDYLFNEANIKQLNEHNKLYYNDYIVMNSCINNEIVRSLMNRLIVLSKITIKFYDMDNNENFKITLKDLFLAQSINKFAFLAYISSFFPSSLRKIAIKYALKRIRKQLKLDS